MLMASNQNMSRANSTNIVDANVSIKGNAVNAATVEYVALAILDTVVGMGNAFSAPLHVLMSPM